MGAASTSAPSEVNNKHHTPVPGGARNALGEALLSRGKPNNQDRGEHYAEHDGV
jgi:hypothetical protein